MRAMNNLIERLHASFFLYLLPEPFQFLSVASYLSAPLLIGASLTLDGLRIWYKLQFSKLSGLLAIIITLATGIILLVLHVSRTGRIIRSTRFEHYEMFLSEIFVLEEAVIVVSGLAFASKVSSTHGGHAHGSTLRSLNLLSTGMLVSIVTIYNYGLGVALALLAGTPLLALSYTVGRGKRLLLIPVTLSILSAFLFLRYLNHWKITIEISNAPVRIFCYIVLIPIWIQTTASAMLA